MVGYSNFSAGNYWNSGNEEKEISSFDEVLSESKEIADLDKLNMIIKDCIRRRHSDLSNTGNNSGGDFQEAVRSFLRILHEMESELVEMLAQQGKELF